MRRTLMALFAAACLVFSADRPARAGNFPEPSLYPVSWELKVEHDAPKRIVVTVPGQAPQAYWYLHFKITNNTGQEQLFLPTFELVTREGKVIRSDKGISGKVFDAIKNREGNQFLQPRAKIVGQLRQGDDQAVDTVAIWKEPLDEMGAFSIFVTGLCGETQVFKRTNGELVKVSADKSVDELKGVPADQVVTLYKTLQLDYVIYGDEKFADRDEVVAKGEKWIMR